MLFCLPHVVFIYCHDVVKVSNQMFSVSVTVVVSVSGSFGCEGDVLRGFGVIF